METLGSNQEDALMVQEQVKVLQSTTKALKAQHKKINIDKIEVNKKNQITFSYVFLSPFIYSVLTFL